MKTTYASEHLIESDLTKPSIASCPNLKLITKPGTYRTGDGDFVTARRSGADDHLQYKSRVSAGVAGYTHSGHI